MAKRGQLTPTVQREAVRLLGKEITQCELRLMPYVQYVLINDQVIEPVRITGDERDILSDWRMRGWIEGGAGGLSVSLEFWQALHSILLLAYVDYRSQPDD